jgi:hypothetical protein
MNYGYTIEPERRFIFQVFSGYFTVAEIIECSQCLWADPNYATTHNGIVDITKMSPGAVLEDLRPLIAFLKSSPKISKARWAVIAHSPLVTAGSLVYKKAMSGRHSLEVFSTWECACGYLQIDQPRPPEPAFKITRPNAPVSAPV